MDGSDQLFKDIAVSSNKNCSSCEPFVSGFIDLFSGSGESWDWGLAVDDTRAMNSSIKSHSLDGSKVGYEVLEKKLDKATRPLTVQDAKQSPLLFPVAKLGTLEEESEDDNRSISTDSSTSVTEESVGNELESKKEVSDIKDSFLFLYAVIKNIASSSHCTHLRLMSIFS